MSSPIRSKRLPVLLLAAAFLLLVFAGCEASVSIGGGLSGDEIAKEAENALNKVAREEGLPPFSTITCPDDLDGDKGEKTTCYSTSNGEKLQILVTVTSVEGDNVNLDFQTVSGRPVK